MRMLNQQRKTGSSYQNLIYQTPAVHSDYLELVSWGEALDQEQIQKYFTASKSKKLFGDMDLLLNGLLSFNYIQKHLVRRQIEHASLSLENLMKH